MTVYSLLSKEWAKSLNSAVTEYKIYAPLVKSSSADYELITAETIAEVAYDCLLPVTPLKAFFFPIRENVVKKQGEEKRVIIGARNCDLVALSLLDAVFLDEDFVDPYYKNRRDNTIIIGSDCYAIKETCHCTTYGVEPYSEINFDLSLSFADEKMYIRVGTDRGRNFLDSLNISGRQEIDKLPEDILGKRENTRQLLAEQNKELPDREETKAIIAKTDDAFWQEYAKTCVSCGACSVICPTCHCFLLIDREKFEKIKQWDACQYPAFERVAAGEDPLKKLSKRLKNRYECKYIHKPGMFNVIACTGCGRCIEACIGKISKNEVIIAARNKD
ncbi:MAG: 4Fe-4S dicluster domain-containing protein [Candidatus Cloacimonetes bacterium]|nr:4Fe-4S dicluster domain-containing protein [Candidatus Cloacimonadota bacterium]